jgi:hypothetical protein
MRRLTVAMFAVIAGTFFAADGAEARVYGLQPAQNIEFANPSSSSISPDFGE